MSERSEKWAEFYKSVRDLRQRDHVPAFIQEITVGGLWSVQKLVIPKEPRYPFWYRLFNDPPSKTPHEPFYNGWPGDHRGWMRFQSAEEARDFYRLCEKFLSFDEFRALPERPHRPMSDVRIDLDEQGNFAEVE